MNRDPKKSFTLIEILVVIAIIIILTGIVFKMIQVAVRSSSKARCVEKLEKVAHCVEEYFGEYGIYPPVDFVKYEYESVSNQNGWLREDHFWQDNGAGPLFIMGLVAYLELRDKGTVHTNNNAWVPDTQRDVIAKKRWEEFLVLYDGSSVIDGNYLTPAYYCQGQPYSNRFDSIYDPWGSEIHYVCSPPYTRYRMWSNGPDGSDGTADDIHRDKWDL